MEQYICYGCGTQFETENPEMGETDEGKMPFCAECVTLAIRTKIERRFKSVARLEFFETRATESRDGPEIRVQGSIFLASDISLIAGAVPAEWDYLISTEPIYPGCTIDSPVVIIYRVR